MKFVDFEDQTFYAAQQAHPALFKVLAGMTPAEFCKTKAKAFKQNDELAWELVPSETSSAKFLATIPYTEEIEDHADDEPAEEPQPRYPWLDMNERPLEIEPYELCRLLLKESSDCVVLPIEVFPYCGAIAANGKFFRDCDVLLVPNEGMTPVAAVCRLIFAEAVPARVAIGFALLDGMIWEPHVWLVDEYGRILETADRVAFTNYYGVLLSDEGTAEFIRYYYPRRVNSRAIRQSPWTQTNKSPWWIE